MISNYTTIKPGTKPKKELKYHNEPVKIDGIWFQSTKEGLRYSELKEMERVGLIFNLILQPRFDIKINSKHICYYKADFQYVREGEIITEDVKGVRTPVYKLKKKLVEAMYDIEILET